MILRFAYNPAGQIVSRAASNNLYAATGLANGNQSDAVNGLNQVTTTGATAIGYGDNRGNITAIGAAGYAYTSENQLSGAPGAALTYDPLGRLYQVVSGGVTTRFAHDGAALIAEANGANVIQRQYVHGPGSGGEPLVSYEIGTRRYWHADERGSIVAVGQAYYGPLYVNRYDEYGAPASTNAGRFQYTGQAWLPEIGLYYYRARVYNPALGRFMQTDPIGYGSGMNLYAYVGGDPVNLVDPTGTVWWPTRIERKVDEKTGTVSWGLGGGGTSGGGAYDSGGNRIGGGSGTVIHNFLVHKNHRTGGSWVESTGSTRFGGSLGFEGLGGLGNGNVILAQLTWGERTTARIAYRVNPQIRRNVRGMIRRFGGDFSDREIDQVLADILRGSSTSIEGLNAFQEINMNSALNQYQIGLINTYIRELPNTPLNQRVQAGWLAWLGR